MPKPGQYPIRSGPAHMAPPPPWRFMGLRRYPDPPQRAATPTCTLPPSAPLCRDTVPSTLPAPAPAPLQEAAPSHPASSLAGGSPTVGVGARHTRRNALASIVPRSCRGLAVWGRQVSVPARELVMHGARELVLCKRQLDLKLSFGFEGRVSPAVGQNRRLKKKKLPSKGQEPRGSPSSPPLSPSRHAP
jgi:hypothetical protein